MSDTSVSLPNPTRHPLEQIEASGAERLCWNDTGIYGLRTCPHLDALVHCHHCPAYKEAVPRLLDRPLSESYRQEWALHYSRAKTLAATTNNSAVLFRICGEWFGLPTRVIQEVSEPRRIHSLPHRKSAVLLGLINLRGELFTCVSVGQLLTVAGAGSEELEPGDGKRLVVMNLGPERYAFPASEVQGVFRFHSLALRPPPASARSPASACAQGVLDWKGSTVGLLNPDSLFAALGSQLA